MPHLNTSSSDTKDLITVLVEDYFHVGAFENLIRQQNWQNFEPRYEQNTRKALDLLDRHNAKATFFVLGWIAEASPGLIREIVERGHEVANRGYYHRSPRHLTEQEFREDLRRSTNAIESASGQKVIGYRAAEKLSFEQSSWILDVLVSEGYEYDASFLPGAKTPKEKHVPHQIERPLGTLREFPYPTADLGVGRIPIAGGNYFRQIPYTLMRRAVKKWHQRNREPFTFYFHVWELDPDQPRISAASRYNHVRHYRKLDKMEWILHENLQLYKCESVAEHLGIKSSISNAVDISSTKDVLSGRKEKTATFAPVSIVIPCYNEEESLPYLANTLRAVSDELNTIGYEAKLIFIDDKSIDDTLGALRREFAGFRDVRIIEHQENKGVAGGIMTGIEAAETEIVCSMDCDCTYDAHELKNMLMLMRPDVDMITASPYHADGGVRNVPSWRLFLSRGASFLYRRVLRSKLDTYTSCFRVYRRSSILDIELSKTDFLGVAEMLGRLDLRGGTIVEFPAILDVRLFGISKMRTAKTIFGHLKLLYGLARLRWFNKYESIRSSMTVENLNAASEESGK